MTKKDYKLLAAALHYAYQNNLPLDKAILHIADCLALANSRFNKTLFLQAIKEG